MNKQAAFTLIEFTVIVGIMVFLLLSVLENNLPQKMLVTAKVKSLESEVNTITIATYSYLDKYRTLPGDRNRNGKIENAFDSKIDDDESRLFWLQLRKAGLIKGNRNDPNQPTHVFGGIIGVASGIRTGKYHGIHGPFVGLTHIPGDIALILESRNDDANPTTGYIQAHRITAGKKTYTRDYSVEELYNIYFAM